MAGLWLGPELHLVTRDQVLDAVRALGLDPEHVRTLSIGRENVEVEFLMHDDKGQHHGAATAVVRLPIIDDSAHRSRLRDTYDG